MQEAEERKWKEAAQTLTLANKSSQECSLHQPAQECSLHQPAAVHITAVRRPVKPLPRVWKKVITHPDVCGNH